MVLGFGRVGGLLKQHTVFAVCIFKKIKPNNMKKIWIYLLAFPFAGMGQALTVGDAFTDMVLEKVVNQTGSRIRTADYQGKILLFDYWATWCGSCIAAMPKLAEMQRNYGEDIKVILVSYEKREVVEKLLAKRPQLAALGLPIVTEDTSVIKRFPCRSLPHVSWIGKDRKVKAITDGTYANKERVAELLATNKLDVPLKKDVLVFDYTKPFIYPMDPEAKLECRSTLYGYMEGVSNHDGVNYPEEGLVRMFAVNEDLKGLYYAAIERILNMAPIPLGKRMIFQETGDLFTEKTGEMTYENYHSYELILRGKDNLTLRKKMAYKMIQDLDISFDLECRIVKKPQACYVIEPLNKKDSCTIPYQLEYHDNGSFLSHTDGATISANILASLQDSLPVIYEGPANYCYDIFIPKTINSASSFNTELNKVGLSISLQSRELDMVIISKKKPAS
jgi:thiol-disulfide isomerase/thioredoxin